MDRWVAIFDWLPEVPTYHDTVLRWTNRGHRRWRATVCGRVVSDSTTMVQRLHAAKFGRRCDGCMRAGA